MNKTDVSNQITGLRPKVKQAVVHLAHHLTREVKKCEQRKGKRAEKFHKRADTYRKEVLLLKGIKPDDVSRYALLMDFGDREKLLNDLNLPLETKVMVKLATYKSVRSHIEDFRNAHPEWSSKLPQLLETLGIRAKFKKKIQKEQEKQKRKLARRQENALSEENKEVPNKEVKKKDPSTSQDDTPLSEDLDETSEESDNASLGAGNDEVGSDSDSDDLAVESQNDEEESPAENEECSDSDDEFNDVKTKGKLLEPAVAKANSSSKVSLACEEKDSDSEKDNVPMKARSRKSSSQKLHTVPSKASLFAEVRPFAELHQIDNLGELGQSHQESSKLSKEEYNENGLSQNASVEEDTFFVTQENSFLKTVAIKRENGEGLQSSNKNAENSDDDETSTQWATDGKKLKGNRAQRRAKFLGREIKKKRTPADQDQGKWRKNESMNKFNRLSGPRHDFGQSPDLNKNKKNFTNDFTKPNGKFSSKDKISSNKKPHSQETQSSTGESLHPSWEAKRKQKVALDKFEGKKIKFDD